MSDRTPEQLAMQRQADIDYLRNTQRPRGGAALQEYNNVFTRVLGQASGQELAPGTAANSPQARAALSSLGLRANAPFGEVLERVIARAESGPSAAVERAREQAASALAPAPAAPAAPASLLNDRVRSEGAAADQRIAQGTANLTGIYGGQENMTRSLQADLDIVTRAVNGGNAIGDRGRNAREDSPETVAALQRTLIALGQSGRVQLPENFQATGRMDDATRNAIRTIQRNHGERVDGIVGAGTLSTLSALTFDVNNQMLRIGEPARPVATTAPANEGPEWVPLREGNRPNGRTFDVTTTDGQTVPVMVRVRGEGIGDLRVPTNYVQGSPENREAIARAIGQAGVNEGLIPGVGQFFRGGREALPETRPPAAPMQAAPGNPEGRVWEYGPDGQIRQQTGGWQLGRADSVNLESPFRQSDGTVAIRRGVGREDETRMVGGVQRAGLADQTTVINWDNLVAAAVGPDGVITGPASAAAAAARAAGIAGQGGVGGIAAGDAAAGVAGRGGAGGIAAGNAAGGVAGRGGAGGIAAGDAAAGVAGRGGAGGIAAGNAAGGVAGRGGAGGIAAGDAAAGVAGRGGAGGIAAGDAAAGVAGRGGAGGIAAGDAAAGVAGRGGAGGIAAGNAVGGVGGISAGGIGAGPANDAAAAIAAALASSGVSVGGLGSGGEIGALSAAVARMPAAAPAVAGPDGGGGGGSGPGGPSGGGGSGPGGR